VPIDLFYLLEPKINSAEIKPYLKVSQGFRKNLGIIELIFIEISIIEGFP
jgi:hypothetical protein